METATIVPETKSPLSDEHRRELDLATQRSAKVRRAAGVASFNGWATAIFAALSAPFAVFSLSGLFVTGGLAIVAYHEFQGRKRLLQFDPSATRLLGWNQLGLLGVIIIYSVWSMYVGLGEESLFSKEINDNPELREVLNADELEQLVQMVIVVLYTSVIALSVVFQGGNAWYYFSRRKYVEAYLSETPAWAVDVQQRTARQP
ncbi:MAG: hypothetical protein KDA42_18700 [Planctomycetales bacterium]|nr:hypothetical protein [Planctomycetales bacterium]